MRISVIQMDIRKGDIRGNWDRAYSGLQKAARYQAQIVLLPEMWSTGFAYPELSILAEGALAPTLKFLGDAAREARMWILSSLPEVHGEQVFNTLYFVSPTGEIAAQYRKIHLFPPLREDEFLVAGDVVVTASTEWGPIGGMICFDLRFPELGRLLALAGAKVLFVPAQFPYPREDHWVTLLRARAIENQVFVVGCNRVGSDGDLGFFGQSCVIDPWGRVMDALDDRPGVLAATLDLDDVDKVRGRIPCWEMRRPDVYGWLSD